MKILIVGNWATNKGDRAISSFLVQQLKSIPQIEKVYVSATLPEYLKKYMEPLDNVEYIPFGCDAFVEGNDFFSKLRRKIKQWYYFRVMFPQLIKRVNCGERRLSKSFCCSKFFSAIQDCDFVLLTGGHHITSLREYDSLHSITYELGLMWLSKKPYSLWAQTIGPLEFHEERNKQYVLKLLEGADSVFIRDENSSVILQQLGYQGQNLKKTYDSVFGVHEMYPLHSKRRDSGIVGISIFYANLKDDRQLQAYLDTMAEVCNYIIQKGYSVRFFPMETEDQELQLINQIRNKAVHSDRIDVFNTNISTKKHILAVSDCEMFVGHKTHSVIISLATATPLIAICYHPKTADFMALYELDKYAIADCDFTSTWFFQQFDDLEKHKNEIHQKMEQYSKKYSAKVIADLKDIFA
ncbi:polysaccharide pyruvyl transferase family protein [Bittarella massiliensis (ex Durand et al. 2017)]|uniref:polysaccharide pyruvyl transferase family protein n=1 Tax=Bittarella massiliensis (ex Durand et al. 2017) TaxID=1720313 RepID=UPI000946C139|nr:polysaccharide pyruvyl transferase family protein [Bittarella massiliensis (ex Durand et al. 2017)]